ncbi:NtaA/DmoA family FMN-dependent monooxygenase [Actinoplanes sp. NBRC 101535]|uniref:NtaA/DmoA family FMN-dependent monooxygenase n=1 Tax=Actinoplanes sp. NBRC 101535 TaxID=3032196 RepID=UPI002557544A|nr:NtaA/DmoA family FMN-dependent monooxygenase [Actinoplanes sp. NBRC 101535]
MILGAFQTMNPNGTIGSSWAEPGNTSLGYLGVDYWTRLARRLEEGGFDFLFFADSYGYPLIDGEVLPHALSAGMYVPMGDPIVLASCVAAATTRLGVVVTSSTTVERPAAVARRYATLDHLSGGRIGWNIVTGAAQASSAELFGEALIPHDDRYAQAADHVEICLNLWERSWDDDALRLDRETGVFADPEKVHLVEHSGKFLSSRGIFALPPSPQRSPLLVQAGTSKAGRSFAAGYAELVFLGGGDTPVIAAQIADIRNRVDQAGRPRDSVKFVVGAHFVVGTTAEQAQQKRARMLEMATLEHAATTYAWVTGIDLTRLALDAPMPRLHTEQGQTSVDRFTDPETGIRNTVREILVEYRDNGINGTVFVGDPITIADQVEQFLEQTGADGFLVQPHLTPGTYDDLIDLLVPELTRRGLLEQESPTPGTLRARLFPEHGDRLPATHTGGARRNTGGAA